MCIRDRLKAGVASVPPKATVTPPKEIFEPTNFETSIDPANWALVIVPTNSVVLYPVASVRLNAGVASVAPKFIDTPPKETDEFASWELDKVPVKEAAG